MLQKTKKLAFFSWIRYIISNTPVTPLSFRVNAHFGRVFSFMWGCYGKV